MLAHTAVREAEVAVHAVLGKEDCMSYRAIPGVVYTNPEIAGVGDTEEALRKRAFLIVPIKLPMVYSGRFVAENEASTVCASCCWRKMIPFGSTCAGQSGFEIITLAGMAVEPKLTASEWKDGIPASYGRRNL